MGAAGFELLLTIPARFAARAVVNIVRGSVAPLPAPLTRDISGPARALEALRGLPTTAKARPSILIEAPGRLLPILRVVRGDNNDRNQPRTHDSGGST